MTAPHPEPIQLRLELPDGKGSAQTARQPISHDLAAWVARKRRERDGLELRQCDREQIREQLEDMGAL